MLCFVQAYEPQGGSTINDLKENVEAPKRFQQLNYIFIRYWPDRTIQLNNLDFIHVMKLILS